VVQRGEGLWIYPALHGEDVFVHFSAIQETATAHSMRVRPWSLICCKGPKGFQAANVVRA